MSITFSADEIFEMAEQIERNAGRFYREAAKNTSDKKIKLMLLDMAAMEDGHLKTFEEMRKQLSRGEKTQTVFDPDNQAALYLQTMADSHGTEGLKGPAEKLTGKETISQILQIALNSEKESVVFYYGLRGLVSEKAGKDKIEEIINEEISHITGLHRQLMALK